MARNAYIAATKRCREEGIQITDTEPNCENCDAVTNRQCDRCGQRICSKCMKKHPVRNYGMPPEFWPKCKKGAGHDPDPTQ